MQQGLPGSLAVVHGAGAPGSQNAFQIRPGGCHHKVPGKIRKGPGHRLGVLLPAGLPCDDNGAGIHQLPGDSGGRVLALHQAAQPVLVHMTFVQQGRKVYRAFIEHLPGRNGHIRHSEGGGPVFHRQPGYDQLSGSGAHIQTNA